MSFLYDENNNILTNGDFWSSPTDGGTRTGPITVTKDGVIRSASGFALDLTTGAYDLTVNGVISSKLTVGVHLDVGLSPTTISKVTVGASGQIHGDLAGIDSGHAVNLINGGVISGDSGVNIAGGGIDYKVTNTGTISGVAVAALALNGGGKHTIINSGLLDGDIRLSAAGINVFNNSGHVTGDILVINAGKKADALTNKALIDGNVNLGDGDNIVTNTGRIAGSVTLGDDNDKFTNNGDVQFFVDLGRGNNTFKNSAIVDGDLTAGTGADNISNAGTINGSVNLGRGANVFTNTGVVLGSVSTGSDADKFTNSGEVNGTITLGSGDDKFTGGKSSETISDEAGKDSYALGAGDDIFDAVASGSGDSSIDTVDGGGDGGTLFASIGDLYSAADATAQVVINLDSIIRVDVFDANKICLGGVASGSDIGEDHVKNFESATGGSGSDVIFGNKLSNHLNGNSGADHLFGGAGNDVIDGGSGLDLMVGGLGKDLLQGSIDSSADRFVYLALADSTAILSGRDAISGFEDGFDKVDLSAITLGACFFRGENGAFQPQITPVPFPQVRVLETFDGWTVQLDRDSDLKVDLAIDVIDAAHTIDWSVADFVF